MWCTRYARSAVDNHPLAVSFPLVLPFPPPSSMLTARPPGEGARRLCDPIARM